MAGHQRTRPAAVEQRLAELEGAVDPDQLVGRDVAADGHQSRPQGQQK